MALNSSRATPKKANFWATRLDVTPIPTLLVISVQDQPKRIDGLLLDIDQLDKRLVAALANKLARTALALLTKGQSFDLFRWNPVKPSAA
jgi:hypothetical protein